MNFESIRSQVGAYKTNENESVTSAQLQKIIAAHTFEIFKDTDRLAAEINNLQVSKTIKAQLVLILSCSALTDFILNSKSDLNLVDVDNVVHNVVQTTGLSYQCALRLITDVFYACGLNFAVEYGPVLSDSSKSVEYRLRAMMPSEMAEAEIASVEVLISVYNSLAGKDEDLKDGKNDQVYTYEDYAELIDQAEEIDKTDKIEKIDKIDRNNENNEDVLTAQDAANKAVSAIYKLCYAGIAKGFYLLGRCYLYGDCGTRTDNAKAVEYMSVAAKQGVPEAAAALGDIYYFSENPAIRNYTLSHHYYTRPGATALNKKRRNALKDIYMQHSANKTTLVFSGLVIALMAAFLIFFNKGIFSDSSRFIIGVIATVLSGLLYVVSIYLHVRLKYNGLRWVIAAQYFIWAVYAFILVLA